MGPDSCAGLLEAWGLWAAESPRLTLSLCPLQFDLQRIVIYCDSRHAELETCCDIPLGPVSNSCVQGWAGNGSLASGAIELSRAYKWAFRSRGCPPSGCGLRGAQ